MPHPIILYDGVCELCSSFVRFILRQDRKVVFQFASLQSPIAARILTRCGVDPNDLDTVYVVLDHDLSEERLLSRSDAVIFVLKQLGTPWRVAALAFQILPKFLRNTCYNVIARHRYRVFGRSDLCTLPRDTDHSRFLDR